MSKLKKSEILYEPLPIGRLGVRKDNQEVIVAQDFSCFGQMLEEYICFGAVHIIIPSSSPEITTLEQMPRLLKKRIRIIDDSKEIETVYRLLYGLKKEFKFKINEEKNFLYFPKKTPHETIEHIDQVHKDIKKLALGFNHNIQIPINTQLSIESLKFLRTKVSDSATRLILAQIEALLNQYKKIEFEALSTPKDDTPFELITVFDKLINDEHYLEYSDTITKLSSQITREQAKLKLKELTRLIGSKNYIGKSWDYIVKIIKVWTGVPLPEFKTIASLIKSNELPSLINMDIARKRAVEMWRNSNLTNQPLRRDGLPVLDGDIKWMPPLDSMKVRSEDSRTFCLGTVGELKKALDKMLEESELTEKKTKRKKTRHNKDFQ
jgi:hypothetical protein